MKTLAFLKWPMVLILLGLVLFSIGSWLRKHNWGPAVIFVVFGYAAIMAAIIWIILKITFLKNPADDVD